MSTASAARKGAASGARHAAAGKVCSYENGVRHARKAGLLSEANIAAFASAFARAGGDCATGRRSPGGRASCRALPGSAQDRLDRSPRDADGNLLRMRDFDAAWSVRGGHATKPHFQARPASTSKGMRANRR